jgi:predicted DNA-binding protein (MmcQ/YjbR family)
VTQERVNCICQDFPGAEKSDPWGGGHDAWKVGGKMFACRGAQQTGTSVKTDSIETAQMLIDARIGQRAPYFQRSWLLLPDDCPEDEPGHRLETFYRLVRARLPKTPQAALGLFRAKLFQEQQIAASRWPKYLCGPIAKRLAPEVHRDP